MTREEAVEFIAQSVKSDVDMALVADAIKALEQEPCEDAISRQAVLDIIDSDWKYEGVEQHINELPSVTPKQKTGHWVKTKAENIYGWPVYECSECKTWLSDTKPSNFKFCFGCGAKMESEE